MDVTETATQPSGGAEPSPAGPELAVAGNTWLVRATIPVPDRGCRRHGDRIRRGSRSSIDVTQPDRRHRHQPGHQERAFRTSSGARRAYVTARKSSWSRTTSTTPITQTSASSGNRSGTPRLRRPSRRTATREKHESRATSASSSWLSASSGSTSRPHRVKHSGRKRDPRSLSGPQSTDNQRLYQHQQDAVSGPPT